MCGRLFSFEGIKSGHLLILSPKVLVSSFLVVVVVGVFVLSSYEEESGICHMGELIVRKAPCSLSRFLSLSLSLASIRKRMQAPNATNK